MLRAHVVRNALLPVVTILGMDIGLALGGAFFTESVYGLPGLGKLAIGAIDNFDLPTTQGVVVFATTLHHRLQPRGRHALRVGRPADQADVARNERAAWLRLTELRRAQLEQPLQVRRPHERVGAAPARLRAAARRRSGRRRAATTNRPGASGCSESAARRSSSRSSLALQSRRSISLRSTAGVLRVGRGAGRRASRLSVASRSSAINRMMSGCIIADLLLPLCNQ